MSEWPNRDSCDCYPVPEQNDVAQTATKPGAFHIAEDGSAIWIKTPDGWPIRLPLDGSRGWRWDGNREKPTVTPSILNSSTDPETKVRFESWHGFLTAGRLVSC